MKGHRCQRGPHFLVGGMTIAHVSRADGAQPAPKDETEHPANIKPCPSKRCPQTPEQKGDGVKALVVDVDEGIVDLVRHIGNGVAWEHVKDDQLIAAKAVGICKAWDDAKIMHYQRDL